MKNIYSAILCCLIFASHVLIQTNPQDTKNSPPSSAKAKAQNPLYPSDSDSDENTDSDSDENTDSDSDENTDNKSNDSSNNWVIVDRPKKSLPPESNKSKESFFDSIFKEIGLTQTKDEKAPNPETFNADRFAKSISTAKTARKKLTNIIKLSEFDPAFKQLVDLYEQNSINKRIAAKELTFSSEKTDVNEYPNLNRDHKNIKDLHNKTETIVDLMRTKNNDHHENDHEFINRELNNMRIKNKELLNAALQDRGLDPIA